jgi:hypothetical protein
MIKKTLFVVTVWLMVCAVKPTIAQIPENISDRYIRVAEVGELVDSINVWGDVNSAGRYLVPEGTILPELISYSFGFGEQRGGGAQGNIDWTKTQIEIKISRFDGNRRAVEVAYFRYLYHDPEPIELWEFELQNNDVVTIRVRNKPSFNDYVGIVAPVISIIATSFLLIENLRN